MGRIIRRTFTITICESWTITWTGNPAEDQPATSGKSKSISLPQTEQKDDPQETEVPAQAVAVQPETPAESDTHGDADSSHESGGLPSSHARGGAASSGA